MFKRLNTIGLIMLLANMLVASGASAAILDKDEIEQADLAALQGDTAVFQSIGMGIALSLAQCEGVDLCSLNVDATEIEELIKALDTRIEALTLKQEDVPDPAAFEEVLAIYVNTRDSYGANLDKLKEIQSELQADEGFLDDGLPEPDFPVETARDAELLEYIDDLELFEDEEIEDDEGEWDLPPLPDDLNNPNETP